MHSCGGHQWKGLGLRHVGRMLRQAGYRTGLFTSPASLSRNRTHLIDGRPIDPALICKKGWNT